MDYPLVLAMWTPGHLEIIVVVVVVLLLFGRKVPDLARNLGRGFVELIRGYREVEDAKKQVRDEVKSIKADTIKAAKNAIGLDGEDKPSA